MLPRTLRTCATVLAAGAGAFAPIAALVTPAHADVTVTTTIANNTLTVTGTNAADDIQVFNLPGNANALLMLVGNTFQQQFDRATFTQMNVVLRGGDDRYLQQRGAFADLPVKVDGGAGNDTITTGDGADTVLGGTGNDDLDGGPGADSVIGGGGNDHLDGDQGTDTLLAGGGADTVQWDPGDGSDTVEGGAGVDTFQFNGSNATELTTMLPFGRRVLFRRNIANVQADMDGIEAFRVRLLGGEDTFSVEDLRGTAMRDVTVDLGSAFGTPDTQVDTVVVNGSNRADHLAVTTTNGQVDVTGQRPVVHILSPDTNDFLDVFTLGGNDTVNIAPDVPSVLFTFVDLGLDQV